VTRLRFEARAQPSLALRLGVAGCSALLGLLVGGVILFFSGVNPLRAYGAILKGALGSSYNLGETLVIAIPISLVAVGLALAFRLRFLNIGAKGQYVLGAIAATAFALRAPPETPRALLLLAMGLAAALAGALWASLPALLRTRLGVNEVIATLLLNYVAVHLLSYFIFGPWQDPESRGFPLTASFPQSAWLPRLLAPPSRVHLGLVLALLAAVGVWVALRRLRFGYEARVIGENERAARYAGIQVARRVLVAAALSGALAGLAGMVHTTGVLRLLQAEIGSDYGYTAIIAVWLAGLDPLVALFTSFLLAALEAGGYQVQISMRVPFGIVGVIESAILFALLGGEFFLRYRLVRRNRS
jgi:simple sugar transport system permease protein